VFVRLVRPSGAGALPRKRRGEGAWRERGEGGKGGSQKPKVAPYPIPMRRAYHGTDNRLAPTVHFSEGGKTAYCNAALMQFALSAVMF
jgi:hypothetical protein